MNLFNIGQLVRLKSNPQIKGAIIGLVNLNNQTKYDVFVNGSTQNYFESQLILASENKSKTRLNVSSLHNVITATQITKPSLFNLYSLNTSRIDFIPYQFRPVLKFIRSDRPRILIADSVGVGKTIEAGLILRELQARRNVKSILIICPRPLVAERKWESEMKRFDEKFVHLNGESLRYCINEMDLDGEWPANYSRVIMPYSLCDETLLRGTEKGERKKRKIGLLDLNPPPRFDLVIVDEAHHIRNPNTIRHEVVSFFCNNAEAVVFLTATPIQIGNQDLFVLLKLLRPDLIIDQESFKHLTEPNPYINHAVKIARIAEADWKTNTLLAIEQAANTNWGKAVLRNCIEYKEVIATLNQTVVSEHQRIELIKKTENLHTLSSIINRTRRRDIGNFTIRKPETVYVPFSPTQRALHDKVVAIQEEIFHSIHASNNVKFMLTTIRRQTASCIFGLQPFLRAILNKHLDELELLEDDIENEEVFNIDTSGIKTRIEKIIKEAEQLDETIDPKFEALLNIILQKQKMTNNRVMVFSTFRHTLQYLYKILLLQKVRVGLIHGDINDEERRALRNRFALEPSDKNSVDVLLFSEVGCEGLDYQFCDCMVNYDLPWNPMKIEQRIGRIDRNGQKSESVLIYNLITPDTVDADIYERCLLRIGVFTNSIGDCEEILGEITNEIQSINNNYLLNEKERKQKLQQVADNQIRLLQEQELLEQKQHELFGITVSNNDIQSQINNASSFWLNSQSLFRLVNAYFEKKGVKDHVGTLNQLDAKNIRISTEVRKKMLSDFLQLPPTKNNTYLNWENWLRNDNQFLKLTANCLIGADNEDTVFINPMHPLVLQAAKNIEIKPNQFIGLSTYSDVLKSGSYEFGIYQWHYTGLKNFTELIAVCDNQLLREHLFSLLTSAEDNSFLGNINNENIENAHFRQWSKAKNEHVADTQQIIKFKKVSLQSSHDARIALISDQLAQAKESKITKMRKAQLANAEQDYNYRLEQLEQSAMSADIVANNIIYGVLKIIN